MEVSFQQTVYNVMESDGFVEVCVVLSGVLERDVTVSLFTVDFSAVGKLCSSCSCVCCYIAMSLEASKDQYCSFHSTSHVTM